MSENQVEDEKDLQQARNFELSEYLPALQAMVEDETSRMMGNMKAVSHDHEVFIENHPPLIVINDNNMLSPDANKFMAPLPKPSFKDVLESQTISVTAGSRRFSKIPFSYDQSIVASELEEEQSALTSGQESYMPTPKRQKRLSVFSSMKASLAIEEFSQQAEQEDEKHVDIFNQDKKDDHSLKSELKKKLKKLMDSNWISSLMTLLIIFALFGDNIRIICFHYSSDDAFSYISLVIMTIFLVEIVINFYISNEYRFSFFFWLDLLSTISLILDVNFISSSILPDTATQTVQLARASRAARIGTRAVRIIRLVRLVKLYKEVQRRKKQLTASQSLNNSTTNNNRIFPEPLPSRRGSPSFVGINLEGEPVKFSEGSDSITKRESFIGFFKSPVLAMSQFSSTSKVSAKAAPLRALAKTNSSDHHHQELEEIDLKESRVGRKLSELTTKRVIILVLALLLLIPLFTSDMYFSSSVSADYETALLEKMFNDELISVPVQDAAIDSFIPLEDSHAPTLVYMANETYVFYEDKSVDLSELRPDDETETITIKTRAKGVMTFIMSSRKKEKISAYLDLGRTIFVCVVLTVASLLFSWDANHLILRPIERMIKKVNMIAKNPLLAKEHTVVKDHHFDNETVQIENAITKIGGLLALGFGDAGSMIVASNIAKSGDMDPMLPGRRKMAVYGFCDIRNFTDATEVLQEEVMVFVNSIAEIVHSMVDKYTGAANKNIGDAFLLVWKLPEDSIYKNEDGSFELDKTRTIQNTVDFSLISFLKIYAKINRDPSVLHYREHPGLNERLPNYQVKMGFGLHIGWAIEGAIGSEFKVDASYLSPNVNMASRLEAATKQYGVPLLFSGDLHQYLSLGMKACSRQVDRVTVKGSVKPIDLYTVDMDVEGILPGKDKSDLHSRVKQNIQKNKKLRMQYLFNEGTAVSLLETDKDLQYILRNHNPEFNENFNSGFESYLSGEWSIAKKKFARCLEMIPEDGPTKNIVSYLEEHDYISPEEWEGYRILTEK